MYVTQNHFPVVYSILNGRVLKDFFSKAYPSLGFCKHCELLCISINDIYLITGAGNKRYVLRVHHYQREIYKKINTEIALITYLLAQGFPTIKPIQNQSGQFINEIIAPEGKRYAVLFEYVEGARTTYNPESCATFGKLIAVFHQTTDNWQLTSHRTPLDIKHLISIPLRKIKFYHQDSTNLKSLMDIAEKAIAKIQILPITSPHYGICHGDIIDNSITDSHARITLFDFDCFGIGWRMYDVAQFLLAIQQNILPKDTHYAGSDWILEEAFMSNYQATWNFTQAEIAAIPAFMIARLFWEANIQLINRYYIGKQVLDICQSNTFNKIITIAERL